jgi:hypothetical protein
MKTPVHLLKGLFYLTSEELNKKLIRDNKNNVFYDRKWSDECKRNGIFFDLSQVRWVNIGAASLLTLWIERAKKDNIQVYVALPYKKLTTKEEDKTEEIEKKLLTSNKEKRIRANLFLKVIQFDRVIKCEHIINDKEVLITENIEYQSKEIEEQRFNTAFEEYITKDASTDFSLFDYKYIVPLTWIDSRNVEQGIDSLKTHFSKVLANKDRGIEIFDVLALKNVLLSELLKNVREHAGEDTKHGLLAIGLMATKSLGTYQNRISTDSKKSSTYTDNIEQPYVKWLFESKFDNFIEIYFGDSGIGILDSGLEKAFSKNDRENKSKLEILNWAFDKWSTRKDEPIRGTKGLYQIKRTVDKYEGIILVKTDNLVGGYQKGGYSFPSKWIENNENIKIPGTFIQIKLCPYKDVIKFDFKFEISPINKQWSSIMHELTKENRTSFSEWIQQQNEFKEHNTLLVLKFKEKDIKIQAIHDTLLNLKDLSFIRNSNNAIVVYLINDIGTDLLSNIADSINQMIKKEHGDNINPEIEKPNFENVYSPVLIIGKENNIFWFGEGEDILLTLNEIYMSQSVNLNNLKYFNELSDERRQKVRHYFETEMIVSIDSNNNIMFNFSNIQSLFPEEINRNISSQKSYQRPICSPKLNVVEEWYDINSIFKRKESQNKEVDLSHFYAFGLYLKFREKYPEYIVSPKITHILIDHSQQDELAKEFAKLMGIDNANIVNIQEDVDNNIPRRTQLFDPKDDVIIITTIVSSSETIRRLVKFAKRDLANPMIILCLIDKRKDIKPIETWGTLTDILSIHIKDNYHVGNTNAEDEDFSINKYSELLSQIEKCQTYIAPNYEKEENGKNYKIDKKLKTHFIEKKAVHYNHIGNVNNRHFTFYLDKQKILETNSFIWDEFVAKIDSWINKNRIDKFILVIPQYIKENTNIWTGCVDYIQKKIENKIFFIKDWNVDKPNLIKEYNNFVFLDFGALTGNTINRFIENLEYPKEILIVILFSQFQDNGHKFYTKVKSLNYLKTTKTVGQIGLFDEYREEINTTLHEVKIKIEFLYNLPIDVYNSSTCPICEHERRLEYYKMNTKYMIDFCEDRKKRLKIKNRKTTNEHPPCDFYYSEKDNKYTELSSVLIMKMFEMKLLLNCAKSNTHNRIEILNKLVDIAKNIEKEIFDPNYDLYAFLFLVSHEVLWLQKEPLVFREIRKVITHIAHIVAVKNLIELTNGFKNFVADEKQCEKIAVRYKYAAITVLRSANKSIFCKNISEIIKNSKKNDGELSNNLVQNTFYHIHSLQINRYNKSGKYFKDLNKQFELLRNESLFTNEQLSAFDAVKIKNNTILQLFGEDDKPLSFISCKEQFTYFQDKFIKLYTSNGHPVFYSYFLALDFRKLDGWEDVKQNTETSEYYSFFNEKISKARENWNYAKERLLPIVTNLPSNVFRSTYFSESIFFSTNYRDKIDTFSKTINELTVDKILNEDFYQSYHHMYDDLYNNLIKFRKIEDTNSEDSLLKIFLQDIPSNLLESIQEIFNDKIFMVCKTEGVDGNLNIFYPKSILNFFFVQILDNIRKKKNDGVSLENITIVFETKKEVKDDKKVVELKIINTGTGQYPSKQNPTGALFQFEEDLKHFDGKLNYETNKEKDTFTLTIKFLDYE